MRWVPPLALVSVALLAACIPLPPGHSPSSRANVPQEIPDWLELRRTTLADVFFHLGAPDDLLAPDGRTLGWVNIDSEGGGALVGLGGGIAITADRLRLLVVRFDGNWVVTDRWLKSYTCIAGQLPSVNQELRQCVWPIPAAGSGENIEWWIH